MSEQPPPEPVIKERSGRIGRYQIIRPLGKGAMGMVYLAQDTVLERDLALKVMVSQIADDPELKQRFEREAKTIAKMTHPNVVTVYDFGYDDSDGSPYIAMERLKGMDLQRAMRQPPPMTHERKVAIIIQVLAGLGHAHQAGIVHRDIKPANIWITEDGPVKIMDFGVARLMTAAITGTGNIVGTADYMSPEQVKGAKVDHRSDIFSVGCLLYELLAGRRPFHSENLMAIFYKITHEEPKFDLIPGGEAYESLLPILRTALHKVKEERYQRAYDFAVDLREWLRAHATTAAQHALEGLTELEAPPTGAPQLLTHAPAATVIPVQAGEIPGGTLEPGMARRAATAGRALGATARVAAAPTMGGPRPAATPYPTPGTVYRPARPEPRPVPARRTGLYLTLGGLAVALLAGGGYAYWSLKVAPGPPAPTTADQPAPPPTVLQAPPPSAEAPPPTLPPPTPEPPPAFGEATGKAAASIKAALAAFGRSNYAGALAAAQEALREDPGNDEAQKIADRALAGQKAEGRMRTAEAALGRGDFAQALSEADAARASAPWDGRITSLIGRIQAAQQQARLHEQAQAQAQRQVQLSGLLSRGDEALAAQRYDAAIGFYDEALKVDPTNQRATLGRTSAVGARAVAQAAAQGGARPAARTFVVGKTAAQSPETRSGSVPEHFEESAGVTVKKGTQEAELPGKIHFELSPEEVKPGERYSVIVAMLNEGSAPIQIQGMAITTTINGKRSSGRVNPLAKEAAPKQRTVIFSSPLEIWKEDTTSWSMEVAVYTARGETYKNQVTWK